MNLSNYNIKWDSQSTCSADSMPLGGYSLGCNVWTEDNQIHIYVGESGAIDENGTLLKLCRIRIAVDDNTLLNQNYSQVFDLNKGNITITAGAENDKVSFKIWAATNKSELHVDYESNQEHQIHLYFDSWRYKDRIITEAERHQCRDLIDYPHDIYTLKDVVEVNDSELLFYHKNSADTIWEKLVLEQSLWEEKDNIINPLENRCIGGLISTNGMKLIGCNQGEYAGCDQMEYHYKSKLTKKHNIKVTVLCSQEECWLDQIKALAEQPVRIEEAQEWWKEYFDRSYIIADEKNPNSEYFKISRNYQLFRYMLGCNYYGEFPTKFNGGLFTFDEDAPTPDFRLWSGAGFTAQNQRLVYWPMLKSGDFEAMLPQFNYYNNSLSTAKTRVEKFYHHKGAFFFEQGNIFGLCTGVEYGWNRDERVNLAEDDNPWVRLHYSSGLEFALMILEYHRYSGIDISNYMELVESILEFYLEHYSINEGKLYIYPSTALETYKGVDPDSKIDELYGCANPTDAVAGINCLVDSLIEYYENNELKKEKYQRIKAICPSVPKGKDDKGEEIYLPAQEYKTVYNCELPQLYEIFPYSCNGLSSDAKVVGRRTYLKPYPTKDHYLGCSWHQNGIFAARLNLLEEADKYIKIKLWDSDRRFPTFWGPGHDWTPDHNQGGSGMIQLQEMVLMLTKDGYELLPTWDKNIDVRFKLHIPDGQVVECAYEDGEFKYVRVTKKVTNKSLMVKGDGIRLNIIHK